MMTPMHPRWAEFCLRLEGHEGCNFRKEDGKLKWDCGGGRDQSKARRILSSMGFLDGEIADTLDYFAEHGGYCDCEILFNLDAADEEDHGVAP